MGGITTMKRILLTSTGFTNKNLEKIFKDNIGKPINMVHAVFVPTAANDEESKSILPFCLQDLTDAGVPEENIVTYNLDKHIKLDYLLTFDAIYFCGGSETYLMDAINKINFGPILLQAVEKGLFYIGVSAGSMIATPSVPNNLGIISNPLEPHGENNITPCGKLPSKGEPINISDNQAVWITDSDSTIIE